MTAVSNSGAPVALIDATGEPIAAGNPLPTDIRQIGGSNLSLQGGANGALPMVESSFAIPVAAGGNLTLNGTSRWGRITIYPNGTTPGVCSLNRSSGGNMTLLSGTLTEASPREVRGPGPGSNVSIPWTLNLGANCTAVVEASGGNAAAA